MSFSKSQTLEKHMRLPILRMRINLRTHHFVPYIRRAIGRLIKLRTHESTLRIKFLKNSLLKQRVLSYSVPKSDIKLSPSGTFVEEVFATFDRTRQGNPSPPTTLATSNFVMKPQTISERTTAVMDTLNFIKPLSLTRLFMTLIYPTSRFQVLTSIAEFAEVHGWLYSSFTEVQKNHAVDGLIAGVSNLWGFVQGTPNLHIRQAFNVKDEGKFSAFSSFFQSVGLSGSLTQCGITAACVAVGISIATMIGVSVTALANDFVGSIVKKLGNVGHSVNGISHIFTKTKALAEWIFSFVTMVSGVEWISTQDADIIKIKKQIAEAQKMAASLVQVLKSDPGQLYHQNEAFDKLDDTIKLIQDTIRASAAAKGNLANCKVHLDALLRDMETLRSARSSFIMNLMPNFVPVVYYLYGEPGQGKTELNCALVEDICKRFGWGGSEYAFNSSSKYADKYMGQMVFKMDDFGTNKDNEDHLVFQKIAGSDKVHLNMAEIQDKGMVFSSRVISMTSNHAYVINSKTAGEPEAINRRRDFLIECVNERYENFKRLHHATPASNATINGERIYESDFSHLTLKALRPIPRDTTGRAPKKRSPGHANHLPGDYVDGKKLSYSNLLNMICNRIEERQADFDARVRRKLLGLTSPCISIIIKHLSAIAGLPSVQEEPTDREEVVNECVNIFSKLATADYKTADLSNGYVIPEAEDETLPEDDTAEEVYEYGDYFFNDTESIISQDLNHTRQVAFTIEKGKSSFGDSFTVPKVTFCCLAGNPGIGKTFMINELIRRFTNMGLTIHQWKGPPVFEERPNCDIEVISDLSIYPLYRWKEWLVRTYDGESTPERIATQMVVFAVNENQFFSQLALLDVEERSIIGRRLTFMQGFYLPKYPPGYKGAAVKLLSHLLPWHLSRYNAEDVKGIPDNGLNISRCVGYLPATYDAKINKLKVMRMPVYSPDFAVMDIVNLDRRWKTQSLFRNLPIIGSTSSSKAHVYYRDSMSTLNSSLRSMINGEDMTQILSSVKDRIDVVASSWYVLPAWCTQLFPHLNIILHDGVTAEELLLTIHNAKVKLTSQFNFCLHTSDKTVLIRTNKDFICQCFFVVPGAVLLQNDTLLQATGTGIRWYESSPEVKQLYESETDLVSEQDKFSLISLRAAKIQYMHSSDLHNLKTLGDAVDADIIDSSDHLITQSGTHQTVINFLSCAQLLLQMFIVMGGCYTIASDKKQEYKNSQMIMVSQSREREKYVYNPNYDPNWKQNRVKANMLAGLGNTSQWHGHVDYANSFSKYQEPEDDYEFDDTFADTNGKSRHKGKTGLVKHAKAVKYYQDDDFTPIDTMDESFYNTKVNWDDDHTVDWGQTDYDYDGEYRREMKGALQHARVTQGMEMAGTSVGNYTVVKEVKNQIAIKKTDKWHPDFKQSVAFDGKNFNSVREMYNAQDNLPRKFACLRFFMHQQLMLYGENYPEDFLDSRISVEQDGSDALGYRLVQVIVSLRFRLKTRVRQMCADPMLLDAREKVIDNWCSITSGETHLLNAIMVGGRVGFTNYHLTFESNFSAVRLKHGDKYYRIVVLKAIPTRDLLIFEAEKTCASFPNICRHIPSYQVNIFNERNQGILVTKQFNSKHASYTNQPIAFQKRVIMKFENQNIDGYLWVPVVIGMNVSNSMMTRGGDCGSPVFLKNKSYAQKFIGFHSNASPDSGQCGMIFKEDFEEYFRPKAEKESFKRQICPLKDELVELYPDGPIPYGNHISEIGITPKRLASQDKADFRRSPFHLELKEEVPKMVPSALDNRDPRLPRDTKDLLLAGLDRFDNPTPVVDQVVLDYATEKISSYIATIFKRKGLDIRVLNKDSSLNSVSTLSGSHPIQLDTSAGYPFCHDKGVKGKQPFITMTEGYKEGLRQISAEPAGKKLCGMVDRLIDKAKIGERTAALFACGLKSEIVARKKVHVEPKTRMYMMCPLHLLVATRMYFHTAAAGFSSCRHELPPQIGFNPYGTDYHQFIERLLARGDLVIEMDFKNWDSTIPKEFMRAIVEIYNRIYQVCDPAWKEEHDVIRRNLHEYLVSPLFLIGNRVYQVPMGQPSGETNTALTNSLVSMILLYYVWHKVREGKGLEANFDLFLEVYDSGNLGDDLLVSTLQSELAHVNGVELAEQYAKLGMTATSPHDKTKPPEKFTHMTKSSFLSRTPVLREGKWFGVIKAETILKMCGWTRVHGGSLPSGMIPCEVGTFDVNILDAMADAILIEFAQLGPNQFAYMKDHIQRCGILYNFSVRTRTYGEILHSQGHILRPELAITPKKDREQVPYWFYRRWLSPQREPLTLEDSERVIQIAKICENTVYNTRKGKFKRQCQTLQSPKLEEQDPAMPHPQLYLSRKLRECQMRLYPLQPRTLTHTIHGLLTTSCQQKFLHGQASKLLATALPRFQSYPPILRNIMLPTPVGLRHGEEAWTSSSLWQEPTLWEENFAGQRFLRPSTLTNSTPFPSYASSRFSISMRERLMPFLPPELIKETLSSIGLQEKMTISWQEMPMVDILSSSSSYPLLKDLPKEALLNSVCNSSPNGVRTWLFPSSHLVACSETHQALRDSLFPDLMKYPELQIIQSGTSVLLPVTSQFFQTIYQCWMEDMQDMGVEKLEDTCLELLKVLLRCTHPSHLLARLMPVEKPFLETKPHMATLFGCPLLLVLTRLLLQLHQAQQRKKLRSAQPARRPHILAQMVCSLLASPVVSSLTLLHNILDLSSLRSEKMTQWAANHTNTTLELNTLLLLRKVLFYLPATKTLMGIHLLKQMLSPCFSECLERQTGLINRLCLSTSSTRKLASPLKCLNYTRMDTLPPPSVRRCNRLDWIGLDLKQFPSPHKRSQFLAIILKKLLETTTSYYPSTTELSVAIKQVESIKRNDFPVSRPERESLLVGIRHRDSDSGYSSGNLYVDIYESLRRNRECGNTESDNALCGNTASARGDGESDGRRLCRDGDSDREAHCKFLSEWLKGIRQFDSRGPGRGSRRRNSGWRLQSPGGIPQLPLCEQPAGQTITKPGEFCELLTGSVTTPDHMDGDTVPRCGTAGVFSPGQFSTRCDSATHPTVVRRDKFRDSECTDRPDPIPRAVFELPGLGGLSGNAVTPQSTAESLKLVNERPIMRQITANSRQTAISSFFLNKKDKIDISNVKKDFDTTVTTLLIGNLHLTMLGNNVAECKKYAYLWLFEFLQRNKGITSSRKDNDQAMYVVDFDPERVKVVISMPLWFEAQVGYSYVFNNYLSGIDTGTMNSMVIPEELIAQIKLDRETANIPPPQEWSDDNIQEAVHQEELARSDAAYARKVALLEEQLVSKQIALDKALAQKLALEDSDAKLAARMLDQDADEIFARKLQGAIPKRPFTERDIKDPKNREAFRHVKTRVFKPSKNPESTGLFDDVELPKPRVNVRTPAQEQRREELLRKLEQFENEDEYNALVARQKEINRRLKEFKTKGSL